MPPSTYQTSSPLGSQNGSSDNIPGMPPSAYQTSSQTVSQKPSSDNIPGMPSSAYQTGGNIPGMPPSAYQTGGNIPGMPPSTYQTSSSPLGSQNGSSDNIPGMPSSAYQTGGNIPGMPPSTYQTSCSQNGSSDNIPGMPPSAYQTSSQTGSSNVPARPATAPQRTGSGSISSQNDPDPDAKKISITVSNPHYVEDEDGGRTEYDVTLRSDLPCHGIQGTPITLNKRFTEFEALYHKLVEAMEDRAHLLPEFPTKGWLWSKWSDEVIQARMAQFQALLNFVCKEKILREHFFLDQFFKIPEMREIINNNR
eukprot:TRINITY_DN2081_c0_g1_i1.p1 TRINITY_DN2081_c0_g1~~TRINITY_DN2081_c0_g1_i1.p1  ORF type:complete len:345 (+),score=71.41 TRINITY_DN2081_c0_g1_i1:109-1035(+)